MDQQDELLALLTSWELEHLYDALKRQRFTKKSLFALEKDDLPSITPFKAEQVLLWQNISEGRLPAPSQPKPRADEAPGPSAQATSSNVPMSSTQARSFEESPGPSNPAKHKRTTILENASSKRMRMFDSSRYAEEFDVVCVLNKSRKGKNILQAYNDGSESPFLSERQRNTLAELIIVDIRDSVDRFQHRYFQSISKKIVAVFTSEDEKTWYRPPHSEGNDTGAPQGKLASKLRNMPSQEGTARRSNSTVSVEAEISTSTFESVCAEPVTEEVTGAQTWLKVSNKPWNEVLKKWRLTAPIRFKLLTADGDDDDYVNKYINEWEILKHKSGYELFLADFKLLYPEAEDSLYIKWDLFVKRSIAIAKKDAGDIKAQAILRDLEKENLNPNSQAVLLLALLPSIRSNRRFKANAKQVKVSEAECRDSYLLHITNANDLQNAVRQRRQAFSQGDKPGGQPLICAVGPSLSDIRSIHVNVTNLDWVATSAISAIDICFKSFFALNTPYPKHSEHIWGTIQRAIYEIKTPFDRGVNFDYSWIKALKG